MSVWGIGPATFVDSGDPAVLGSWLADGRVAGATTSPSLMRACGTTERTLPTELAETLGGRPVSIYPVTEDVRGLVQAAGALREIYEMVFVKVPVLSRAGTTNDKAIAALAHEGHRVNITAIHTAEQAQQAVEHVCGAAEVVLSVFAGRIADTGRDPVEVVRRVKAVAAGGGPVTVLWASTRQLFDVHLAAEAGCDIITVAPDILKRSDWWGSDLDDMARIAVEQFEIVPG